MFFHMRGCNFFYLLLSYIHIKILIINYRMSFQFDNNQILSSTVPKEFKKLKAENIFSNWHFLKQSILVIFASLFIFLFSLFLSQALILKSFDLLLQIELASFFILSMVFLSYSLFLFNRKTLLIFLFIYFLSIVLPFFSLSLLTNIYFWGISLICLLIFWFASYSMQNVSKLFIKFNWKLIFKTGFIYQFIATTLLIITLMSFSVLPSSFEKVSSFNLDTVFSTLIKTSAQLMPKSFLNKSVSVSLVNTINTNSVFSGIKNTFAKVGVSFDKAVEDSLKSMFNLNVDVKLKASDVAIDIFQKSNQITKIIVFVFISFLVLSFINFSMFFIKLIAGLISSFLLFVFLSIHFFTLKEKPAVREELSI